MSSEGNKLEDSSAPLIQFTRPGVPQTRQPKSTKPISPESGAGLKVIPGVVPGLEYLGLVDELVVQQVVECWEVLAGCETPNKYIILNNLPQTVYIAEEDTGCCNRYSLGRLRPFDLNIKDYTGREVIRLHRKFRSDSCCCPCCLQVLNVMAPPGSLIGRVLQEWNLLRPKYRVENLEGETIMNIRGPICTCTCFAEVVFPVMSANYEEVGRITKHWSGIVKECCSVADTFRITFPMDLDVKTKALMLGALFLIDYNYFET